MDAHARNKRKPKWNMRDVKPRFFDLVTEGVDGGLNIILLSLMTGTVPVMYRDQHVCFLTAYPDIFICSTEVKVSM
jgi:hypothetical protein